MQDRHPTRTWWQRPGVRLGVRALVVVVLLVGGGLGWVVHRARVRRVAVAAIVRGGGKVLYDWEVTHDRYPDGTVYRPNPGGKPDWPKWLVDHLGPDYFGDVNVVFLGPRDRDAVMASVGQLSRLEALSCDRDGQLTDAGDAAPLTDAGLIHLSSLTSLASLHLPSPGVTDAGLIPLGGLFNMRDLDLGSSRVTASGLTNLRGMTGLKRFRLDGTRVEDLSPISHLTGLIMLGLGDTPIGDAGLAPIVGLDGLRELFLDGTKITDAGLGHLRDLRSLTTLGLDGTGITDEGLVHLGGLPSLRTLTLSGTRVTDAGLEHLAALKSLAHLIVRRTGVSDDGVAAFQRARPHVRVIR